MASEWQELLQLTQGQDFSIARVRMAGKEISIEGDFELPPLARLTAEEQVFVIAFVLGGGSIKEMEGLFGISYPTVKNRLKRLSEKLQLVEITRPSRTEEALDRLGRGEISVAEALEEIGEK